MSFVKTLQCVTYKKRLDSRMIVYCCDQCGQRCVDIFDYEAMKSGIERKAFATRSSCSTLSYWELLIEPTIRSKASAGVNG